MARTKLTVPSRDHARAEMAALYLKGRTLTEIGERYGMTRQGVSHHVELVKQGWRADARQDIGEATGRELAQLDAVVRAAWDAWERSTQPVTRTVTDRTEAAAAASSGAGQPGARGRAGSQRASVTTEHPVGDVSYLALIVTCVAQRARLLGLNAATKGEATATSFVDLIAQHLDTGGTFASVRPAWLDGASPLFLGDGDDGDAHRNGT